jgi:hypothetical protein
VQQKFRLGRIVMYQSLGFISIVALCWIDEMIGLRSLILGDHPYISDFKESTLEMLFIFAVWFIVVTHTRRLMARMDHLEGFMRMCSWCRRVGKEGRWLHFEEFIAAKYDTKTTHSICEDCMEKQLLALKEEQKQRLLPLDGVTDAAPATAGGKTA